MHQRKEKEEGIMESRTLIMTFKNMEGKKVNVRLNNLREDLTEGEVAAAMDTILSANIIINAGGDLISKEEAEIVVSNTTSIVVK